MGTQKHDGLRVQLEARLGTILARIGRIEGDLRRAPDRDWTEQASLRENDEVLEGLDDLERGEAVTIRRTLRRIESGAYGVCAECGKLIDQKRLLAIPTADSCIHCAK